MKPKFYHELWKHGPIRDEARRLATEALREELKAKGQDLALLPLAKQSAAVTVLLFNSKDMFLQQAKRNLGLMKDEKAVGHYIDETLMDIVSAKLNCHDDRREAIKSIVECLEICSIDMDDLLKAVKRLKKELDDDVAEVVAEAKGA